MQFFILNKFFKFLKVFILLNITFLLTLNISYCLPFLEEHIEGVSNDEESNNSSEIKNDGKKEWTDFDRRLGQIFLFAITAYFAWHFFDFFIDWCDKYLDPNWPFGPLPEPDYTKMPYRIGPEGKVNFIRLNQDIATYFEMLSHDLETWGPRGRSTTPLGRGLYRDGSYGGNISPSFYFFFQVAENYNVYPWALTKIFSHWEALHEIYDCETIYEWTWGIYGKPRSSYFPSFYTDDLSTYKASSKHPDATL